MKQRLNTLMHCMHNNFIINGTRRYAGHSKWQNIKHIKQEQDTARAKLFQSFIIKMTAAVKEADNPNPLQNIKLANLIDQAKKANMPASTLNTFLERMKNPRKRGETHIIPIRAASGCTLILYATCTNLAALKINLNTMYRKYNAKPADSAMGMFDRVTYIVASKDCDLDQATEDAIQAEAENVEKLEDDNQTYFKFKTEFLFPDKVKTRLMTLGYSIISIEDTCIPNSMIELSDEELDKVNKLKAKLLELDGIEKIEDNIA